MARDHFRLLFRWLRIFDLAEFQPGPTPAQPQAAEAEAPMTGRQPDAYRMVNQVVGLLLEAIWIRMKDELEAKGR
ncbi:hypothetical protein CTA2_8124 [Colletotrichum tanaceti]|uniref:Uncharacterized protein n=1 Tax=Colletotrichum tanaceti TaxID=1306861 RepID=A0A4U6X488_9PEZI|nr:hypothetical protein CTA2_8124 [Colletotrichum tanaceti]TKW49599.1 hypothetical protein CTA1_11903 [Colletotrichum tanaceti]